MKHVETFTTGAVLFATIFSFTLYGVWEDKFWLFAPLLMLIYIALAAWAVGTLRRRQRSEIRCQRSETEEGVVRINSVKEHLKPL